MIFLLKHIRKLVYALSLVVLVAIYFLVIKSYDAPALRNIQFTEHYAFAALTYSYLALLVSPLYINFPPLPLRALATRARRALGVSAFGFAALHASFAFFSLLGGFPGLAYLNSKYLIAISLSTFALIILFGMAATSFDFAVKKLGKRWKRIHQLVYLVGFAIIVHMLLIGTAFINLGSFEAEIVVTFIFILLFLEVFRINKVRIAKSPIPRRYDPLALSLFVILFAGFLIYFSPVGYLIPGFNIHAAHVKELRN